MRDLTPPHLRCALSVSCPSVHELDDGRILITGDKAAIGPDGEFEATIIVSRELLSGVWPEMGLVPPQRGLSDGSGGVVPFNEASLEALIVPAGAIRADTLHVAVGTLEAAPNPYDPLTPDMPHKPSVSDL